jgi:hypothetical protein
MCLMHRLHQGSQLQQALLPQQQLQLRRLHQQQAGPVWLTHRQQHCQWRLQQQQLGRGQGVRS